MLHRAADAETRAAPLSLAPGTLGTALGCVALVSIWGLSRTYHGIVGDAILYIGRGLADLDRAGIGSDIMFEDDGQSQFSLFTLVVRGLLGLVTPGQASLILVAGGQALWLAAIGCFVTRLHAGHRRLVFAALICVAVLPSSYGPYQRLHFAEPLAVPRPYAEGLVLFALMALLCRRDRLAAVLLILAGLLHPIMALAGIGTWLVVKSSEQRLWVVAAVIALGAALGAAGRGVPLVERVFVPLDPEWRAMLLTRSPMLFPSQWAASDFAAIFVQAATLGLSASLLRARPRAIFVGALLVGLCGLGLSAIFGDRLSLLLVVQAQPWRALWLMAVLAAVGFAHCGAILLKGPPASRLVFLLLLFAWCFIDSPLIACMGAAAAITIHILAWRRPLAVRGSLVVPVALAVGALVLFEDVKRILAYVALQALEPAGGDRSFVEFWDMGLVSIPIALAAVWGAYRRSFTLRPVAAVLLTGVLLVAAIRFWDDRAAMQTRIETEGPPADLVSRVGAQQGSVLWVDGIDEPLFWLHRANWYSTLQGTGAVFSRPLAIEWERRKKLLIELGFLPAADSELPWDVTTRPLPQLGRDQIERLCGRANSLAWIVVPVLAERHDPPGAFVVNWRPPTPLFRVGFDGETPQWSKIDHYALAACAANSAGRAGRPSTLP